MSKTITAAFTPYIGTVEYNGIVKTIQEWFYGTLIKASWCATSCSYFADQVGVLDQLGGKNENVYNMMVATEKAHNKSGKGTFLYRKDIPKDYLIPRGTVIFMLHSGTVMTETSSKHVTTADKDFQFKGSGYFDALGGNQSDAIRVSRYSQKEIYAIYIPDYGTEPQPEPKKHNTLRRGDHGDEVKTLQSWLNLFGYRDQNDKSLAVDGSFGRRTEDAVKRMQKDQGLVVDGICGPQTWARIDELNKTTHAVTVTTEVYVRRDPWKNSTAVGILTPGEKYIATRVHGDWTYIATKRGWSKTVYLHNVTT